MFQVIQTAWERHYLEMEKLNEKRYQAGQWPEPPKHSALYPHLNSGFPLKTLIEEFKALIVDRMYINEKPPSDLEVEILRAINRFEESECVE
jgi:hypothetical protein